MRTLDGIGLRSLKKVPDQKQNPSILNLFYEPWSCVHQNFISLLTKTPFIKCPLCASRHAGYLTWIRRRKIKVLSIKEENHHEFPPSRSAMNFMLDKMALLFWRELTLGLFGSAKIEPISIQGKHREGSSILPRWKQRRRSLHIQITRT